MWGSELFSRSSIAGFVGIALDYSDVNISLFGCEKVCFGFLILDPFELVTPGFLRLALLRKRFPFVAL